MSMTLVEEHQIDLGSTQDFGCHAVYRDDLSAWWWVISRRPNSAEPEIIATGPGESKDDAIRKAQHFLGPAKALLGDA